MDRGLGDFAVSGPDEFEIIGRFLGLADEAVGGECEPRLDLAAEAFDGLERPDIANPRDEKRVATLQLNAVAPTRLAKHDGSAIRPHGVALVEEVGERRAAIPRDEFSPNPLVRTDFRHVPVHGNQEPDRQNGARGLISLRRCSGW